MKFILMTNIPKHKPVAVASGDDATSQAMLVTHAEELVKAKGHFVGSWIRDTLCTYKDKNRTLPAGLYWIEVVPEV